MHQTYTKKITSILLFASIYVNIFIHIYINIYISYSLLPNGATKRMPSGRCFALASVLARWSAGGSPQGSEPSAPVRRCPE